MDQLKILDYKCRFLCILRLVSFINRSDFQKQAFVNTDVKSCTSELIHKSFTLFICAVVSSIPDTGAAILGYFTVFEKHFCETKHLKQKAFYSASTLRFITYTSETKLHQ